MMNCPHCKQSIGHVEIQDVKVAPIMQQGFHGCAYLCPRCKAVLSVGIDPLVLQKDTVDMLRADIVLQIEKLFQKYLPA